MPRMILRRPPRGALPNGGRRSDRRRSGALSGAAILVSSIAVGRRQDPHSCQGSGAANHQPADCLPAVGHDGGCDPPRHQAAGAGAESRRHRRRRHHQRRPRTHGSTVSTGISWPRCGRVSTRTAPWATASRAPARRSRPGFSSCARRLPVRPASSFRRPTASSPRARRPVTALPRGGADDPERHHGKVHRGQPAEAGEGSENQNNQNPLNDGVVPLF